MASELFLMVASRSGVRPDSVVWLALVNPLWMIRLMMVVGELMLIACSSGVNPSLFMDEHDLGLFRTSMDSCSSSDSEMRVKISFEDICGAVAIV